MNITEKAIHNSEQLKEKTSSSKVFVNSLDLLRFSKSNVIRKTSFLLIEFAASLIMSCQISTISLVKSTFELLIGVMSALVAIVFTGYAFFQALINDELLVALLSVEDSGDKSQTSGSLISTNKYFAEVMIFQISCLVADVAIVIFSIILPDNWCLTGLYPCDLVLSSVFILAILHCNIEIIWEMKSFIFNTFQLFNLHACARMRHINDAKDCQ